MKETIDLIVECKVKLLRGLIVPEGAQAHINGLLWGLGSHRKSDSSGESRINLEKLVNHIDNDLELIIYTELVKDQASLVVKVLGELILGLEFVNSYVIKEN